ncbi:MAG: hypothetical protein AAGF24_02915 [Cyanobacteria bacterium P01_H01_bin.121]
MAMLQPWRIALSTVLISAGLASPAFASPKIVQSTNLPASISNGTTVGATQGNRQWRCDGYIPAQPDMILRVTNQANLQLVVRGSSDLRLQVDGPINFCLNHSSGNALVQPGLFVPGEYRLYVGSHQGVSQPFNLSVQPGN